MTHPYSVTAVVLVILLSCLVVALVDFLTPHSDIFFLNGAIFTLESLELFELLPSGRRLVELEDGSTGGFWQQENNTSRLVKHIHKKLNLFNCIILFFIFV